MIPLLPMILRGGLGRITPAYLWLIKSLMAAVTIGMLYLAWCVWSLLTAG